MTNGSNLSSKLSILEEYQMVKFFQYSQTFKLWLLLDVLAKFENIFICPSLQYSSYSAWMHTQTNCSKCIFTYSVSLTWQGTNIEALERELIRICAVEKAVILSLAFNHNWTIIFKKCRFLLIFPEVPFPLSSIHSHGASQMKRLFVW